MPKRQSAEISPSASTRSRSTIAKSPETSFVLVLCARSQPLSAHCFKLIFVSGHKQAGLIEHSGDEMLASRPPLRELFRSQNVRVDLASKFRGNTRQQFAKLPQSNGPNHHQIQVAVCLSVAACKRPENKSQANSRIVQRFSQD